MIFCRGFGSALPLIATQESLGCPTFGEGIVSATAMPELYVMARNLSWASFDASVELSDSGEELLNDETNTV